MMTEKMKSLGARSLKYLFFLTAVLAWMIVLGPKEKLTANEQIFLQDFAAQSQMEGASSAQVASDGQLASGNQYGIVLENGLKARSGPGIEYPAILMLYQNNEVRLIELTSGGWWKIQFNGAEYYVKSEFIAPRNTTGKL